MNGEIDSLKVKQTEVSLNYHKKQNKKKLDLSVSLILC